MATKITLPKDAEDKEVSLDTELLYDEYGNPHNIVKFIYHHDCGICKRVWTVEYDNGIERFVSVMYLTQPESWKKLEDDLDKCISNNEACCYFSKSGMCCDCTIDSSSIDYKCDSLIFNSIKERIRKLRSKE